MAVNAQQPGFVRILLAEDNPGDVRLIREALRHHRIQSDLQVITDGEKALKYIENLGRADGQPPDLIVLDLNLPKSSGREILERIQRVPQGWQIPVIVLSSSASPIDCAEAIELGARCFITKPGSLDEFLEIGAVISRLLQDRGGRARAGS